MTGSRMREKEPCASAAWVACSTSSAARAPIKSAFYMYLMQESLQSNLQIPPGQSPPHYGYNTVTEVI